MWRCGVIGSLGIEKRPPISPKTSFSRPTGISTAFEAPLSSPRGSIASPGTNGSRGARKEPAAETADPDDVLADLPAPTELPSAPAERASQGRWLHRFLLDTLDDTERAVFTLHFGDEMPLAEITRLLRLDNPSGAKAYIVGAKRKLARAVSRLRAQGTSRRNE